MMDEWQAQRAAERDLQDLRRAHGLDAQGEATISWANTEAARGSYLLALEEEYRQKRQAHHLTNETPAERLRREGHNA